MSVARVPTQYKLIYFNLRALAENSRYLFALSGVEYEDYRYKEVPSNDPNNPSPLRPEFIANKEKFPFGQVPVLQIGGESGPMLAQSRSIERYLAKQFGFFGSSDLEGQYIDSIGEAIRDIRDAYWKAKGDAKANVEVPKFFSETLPKHLGYINRFAQLHSTSPDHTTIVGSKISLADVQLFNFLSFFFDDTASVTKALEHYPTLSQIVAAVGHNPRIAEWVAKRPQTIY